MNAEPSGIRVLLADDNSAVRYGFRLIIDAQPDMRVVAESVNGHEAFETLSRESVDVAIVDVRMPRMDGLELVRRARTSGLATRIIIATTFDEDAYVYEALRLGVPGFLIKHSATPFLVEAIRAVHGGQAFTSPSVTVRLLQHVNAMESVPVAEHDLSAREMEVVKLIAGGLSNPEIAAALYISLSTVKTHVSNVQRKLGTTNRLGIAAWAWQTGNA